MDLMQKLTLIILSKVVAVEPIMMVMVWPIVMDHQVCYLVRQRLMLPSNRQSETALPVTVLDSFNNLFFTIRIFVIWTGNWYKRMDYHAN
jgi:hypothetical protein